MREKGISHLRKDKRLSVIIHRSNWYPLEPDRDVFVDLVRSIVSQQLSTKAAATIYGRFQGLFSKNNFTPRKILNKSVEEFRAAGMSYSKAAYVQNVALFTLENKLSLQDWRNMEAQQAHQLLTSIKGVGEWTAQMILMFSLHHPDILPLKDVGIQNAMKKLYDIDLQGKELENQMLSIAAYWQPHRSLACRFLWSWLDNSPD